MVGGFEVNGLGLTCPLGVAGHSDANKMNVTRKKGDLINKTWCY